LTDPCLCAAQEVKLKVDKAGFEVKMNEAKERSRQKHEGHVEVKTFRRLLLSPVSTRLR
jgi:alanyl-tRNA synthetase